MSIEGLSFSAKGYEQQREVVNAFVHDIMNLPRILGTNLNKIYYFYEGLVASVQASETIGKLADIKE